MTWLTLIEWSQFTPSVTQYFGSTSRLSVPRLWRFNLFPRKDIFRDAYMRKETLHMRYTTLSHQSISNLVDQPDSQSETRVLQEVCAKNPQPSFFNRLSWNLENHTKIYLIPDVSCKIWTESDLGRLSQLALKLRFCKNYMQRSQAHFFQ